MTLVNENGKQYYIDDKTGLVTEARVSEPETTEEAASIADEYRLGDRVEIGGRTGNVISMIPSIYGTAFGVLFDDGDIDEFGEVQLKRTSAEKTVYDSPIQEIFSRYDVYAQMPGYTGDELESKEAEARWLHLNATSLRSYAVQGGIRDPKLDEIILVTSSDLRDMKDVRENADTNENQRYLSSFNQYRIAEEILPSAPNFGSAANVSADWLNDAYEGMEVVETTDADLAARATEVVASLSREQLEDDEFMTLVVSFQNDYLRNDDGREQRFAALLTMARQERLKELPKTAKTAAAEDFSNVDDAALFL
jgi:hypothetical protein